MSINALLPFASSLVMAIFVAMVFRRYSQKGTRATHLLFWGIGLTLYWIGSMTEALHAAFGWNPMVFRLWYLSGAVLIAAWIGQGTVELLLKRRIRGIRLSRILLVLLTIGSLYAAYKVVTAELEPVMIAEEIEAIQPAQGYDEQTVISAAAATLMGTALDEDGEMSTRLSPLAKAMLDEADRAGIEVKSPDEIGESRMPITAVVDGQLIALTGDGSRLHVTVDSQPAGTIETVASHEMYGHAIVSPGVRVLTPFFNTYGLLTLVGGAVYSAVIFLRKRIMPNRVMGNVLIAAGALMPAMGGLFSRIGIGGLLYLGELLGAILMFAGFVLATTVPQGSPRAQQAPAASASGD